MVPGCGEIHSWLRMEPVNAQFRQKPAMSCLFCRFSATIIGKRVLEFRPNPNFKMSDFLIRKRFNFPEPFRLVRKTLLFRSLLISGDLVRQKSSYEPKCSENLSFCPNSRGRFSGGLLDFRSLDFLAESSPQSQKCGLNYTVNSRE